MQKEMKMSNQEEQGYRNADIHSARSWEAGFLKW